MTDYPVIFKLRDPFGNCVQYSKGDVVYKNGEAYVATRIPDLCKSPEHKDSGWEPLVSERAGTTVTFFNSTTAPSRVEQGDEWYNPNTGRLYKYIKDDNSEQWVQIY